MNPGDEITGKVTVTYPDGSKEEIPVKVTVTKRDKDIYNPNTNENRYNTRDDEVKSNDSQNVLPNTGTESSATLATLGIIGVLSGFGLVVGKKKEE